MSNIHLRKKVIVIGNSKRTMKYAICSECNNIYNYNCNFKVKYIKKNGSVVSLATFDSKNSYCLPVPSINTNLLYERLEQISKIVKMIKNKISRFLKKQKVIDYLILTLNENCLFCQKLTLCECFKNQITSQEQENPDYTLSQQKQRDAEIKLLFLEEILLQAKKKILEKYSFIKVVKIKLADINNTIFDFDDMNFIWYKTFEKQEPKNPDGLWEIIKKKNNK
jgi:hypothetical protein